MTNTTDQTNCEKRDNNDNYNNNNNNNDDDKIEKNINKNITEVEEDLGLEYRLNSSILPLRCYLDSHFIQFLLELNNNQNNIRNEKLKKNKQKNNNSNNNDDKNNNGHNDSNDNYKNVHDDVENDDVIDSVSNEKDAAGFPYFQHAWIAPIHLKIDYEPGTYIRLQSIFISIALSLPLSLSLSLFFFLSLSLCFPPFRPILVSASW